MTMTSFRLVDAVRGLPCTTAASLPRPRRPPARRLVPLCAGTAALALATAAHATGIGNGVGQGADEMLNGFDNPDGSATAFEIDFCGDVTGLIPSQSLAGAGLNPFVWANQVLGHAVNPTTVTYDPVANVTRFVQSGDPLPWPIPTNYSVWHLDGNGNPTWHTGIVMGSVVPANPNAGVRPPAHAGAAAVCNPDGPTFQVVSRHWVYDQGLTLELDAVTVSWNGVVRKKSTSIAWLLSYIQTLDPATGLFHAGEWRLTPYDTLRPKPFTITNHGTLPLLIDTIGIIPGVPLPTDPACHKSSACDANVKMLETLNSDGYPPPGDPGSRFKPVPPPKAELQPGESYTFKIE
jgi:hypothetical protein